MSDKLEFYHRKVRYRNKKGKKNNEAINGYKLIVLVVR